MTIGHLSLASFRSAGLVKTAVSFGGWPCDGLVAFEERHRGTWLGRLARLELERRTRLEDEDLDGVAPIQEGSR